MAGQPKNAKILKNNTISNGHPGCSQTLSDLPKVAIKKSERLFDYIFNITTAA
jgi:hypothetical protein